MPVKKFPVEARHILMFARSVGDDNEIYSDADYAKKTEPGAIIAPPTFVQASAQFDPDYGLRPKIGRLGTARAKNRPASSAPRGWRRRRRWWWRRRCCTPSSIRISPPPEAGRRADRGDQAGQDLGEGRPPSGKLVFYEASPNTAIRKANS